MTINIRSLLEKGHAALAAEHAAKEQALRGHPRIGSAGIVAADGNVYGTCHRKALARELGIEIPAELHTDIMWKAGESNEWHWARILGKAGCKLMPTDQDKIKHKIEGVPLYLLGSPDVRILADDTTGPVMGLELKGIFGYTTAELVYLRNTPKNDNLIQAATYSYCLGLPYALCYTNANYFPVNFFDRKKYDGLKSIPPFYRIFYMEWRDDVLWYRDETQEQWVKTIITPQAIEDFYRLKEEMKARKDLGLRVMTNYVGGKEDRWGPHGACGLCEFKAACDRYDSNKDYDEWLSEISLLATTKELIGVDP
jgi:hypothetical protein